MARTRFTLEDLRTGMRVRLAVAPKLLLQTLAGKRTPTDGDAARRQLVAWITQGWDNLDIDVTGPIDPCAGQHDWRDPLHDVGAIAEASIDEAACERHLAAMCNRYQPGSREAISNLFAARALREFNDGPATVHPKDPGWVIRRVNGELALDQMTWGFPVALKGKSGHLLKPKPVNNARFDKLGTFWRRWAAEPYQRCLIPTARFAEAVGEPGRMTTTWLSLRDQPMFAWAGLWSDSREWGPVYTGVMTDAAPELLEIHDRSPVILAPEHWATWLEAPMADIKRFDRAWPAAEIRVDASTRLWKDGWGEPL